MLFALQQFVEGLIWLSLQSRPEYTLPLTYIFLFFALLLWPIYVPVMAMIMEPQKIRRRVLLVLSIVGAVIGILFYASFFIKPEAARVVNQCIYYSNPAPYPILLSYLYVLVTVGSGIISSRPILKLFCLLILIFSLITWLVYTVNFISVWCFFAAIISGILYFQPQK